MKKEAKTFDQFRSITWLIPALRRYARALLHDRAAADDLVQDCIEIAITRWHQRRLDGDPRTWMFAILHNLAISRLRRDARRGQHTTLDDAPESALARPPTQDDALRRRDLLRGLETLSADQRAVLLLVSVEDLSYAETARVLSIPLGTVMSRLSRARERLLAAMENHAPAAGLRRVK